MKLICFTLFILTTVSCFSQVDTVHVFVGKSEKNVSDYFNRLNDLKSNAYYKIKRNTTDNGDLDLSVEFSLEDEDYYKCSMLTATFQRVKGTDYCTSQSVFGKIEHANFYLSFIKDNFTRVSDGIWEMPSSDFRGLKIVALYKKIEETHFGIIFELREPDE